MDCWSISFYLLSYCWFISVFKQKKIETCLQTKFLNLPKKSAGICEYLLKSNKNNERIGKHCPPRTTFWNRARITLALIFMQNVSPHYGTLRQTTLRPSSIQISFVETTACSDNWKMSQWRRSNASSQSRFKTGFCVRVQRFCFLICLRLLLSGLWFASVYIRGYLRKQHVLITSEKWKFPNG